MKTTKRFLYFAAVSSLLFAACNREAVAPEENLTPGENTGETYPVYFGAEATLNDAASGDDITAGTKVSLTPDADDSSFEASWDNLDKGSIQYSCNDDNFYLTDTFKDATWNGSSNSFIVYFDAGETGHIDKKSNWKYTLVYPHFNSLLSGKDRVQKGNAYNSEYDLMIGNASVTSAKPGYDDNGKTIIFNMLRETGIAYFHFTSNLDETLVSATLTVDGGTIASEAVSLKSSTNYSEGFKYSGEQYNSINMTFTDAPSALDFKLWFNVLPTKYNSSTLVIETTAHKLTLTKKAGKDPYSYDTQKLYKVTRTVADAKWVALDEYNVNLESVTGGTLSASPVKAVRGTEITLTAIADDGYEFKNDWNVTDSHGNKITVSDGKFTMPESDVTVTASFAAITSSDINLSLNGIANCYIVPPTAGLKYKFQTNNINGSVDNVTGCSVLWESFGTDVTPNVGDLVKNVSYADGYISFTTTGKAGNALIAAKNGEDILWSWHIWLTDIEEVTLDSGSIILDRNLGATSATKGDNSAIGLYYQWGRKDPFLNSNMKSTANWPSAVVSDSNSTIEYSIRNPMLYIKTKFSTNNNYGWKYGEIDSGLWSSTNKTAYDPCPYGYCCANSSIWSNIFTDSVNNGYTISSCWFPQNGYLDGKSSSFTSGGVYLWFSDSVDTSLSKYIYSNGTGTGNKYSTYGYGVRCQKQ